MLSPGVRNSLLGIAAVVGAITTIYTGAWMAGVAPITNAQAEKMIDKAVRSESQAIQRDIGNLERKLEDQLDQTGEIKEQLGRTDEKTISTRDTVEQILLELRELRRGLNK